MCNCCFDWRFRLLCILSFGEKSTRYYVDCRRTLDNKVKKMKYYEWFVCILFYFIKGPRLSRMMPKVTSKRSYIGTLLVPLIRYGLWINFWLHLPILRDCIGPQTALTMLSTLARIEPMRLWSNMIVTILIIFNPECQIVSLLERPGCSALVGAEFPLLHGPIWPGRSDADWTRRNRRKT